MRPEGSSGLAILTHDLFSTHHDQANRAAVATVAAEKLNLAGIALHAVRRTVVKVLDWLRPHASSPLLVALTSRHMPRGRELPPAPRLLPPCLLLQ